MTPRIWRSVSAVCTVIVAGCDVSEPFRVLTDDRVVERVTISPGTVTASIGDTVQVTAEAIGPGNHVISEAEIVWSSGDQAIVRSLGDGRFFVFASGDAQLFATSRGRRGQAQLLVAP